MAPVWTSAQPRGCPSAKVSWAARWEAPVKASISDLRTGFQQSRSCMVVKQVRIRQCGFAQVVTQIRLSPSIEKQLHSLRMTVECRAHQRRPAKAWAGFFVRQFNLGYHNRGLSKKNRCRDYYGKLRYIPQRVYIYYHYGIRSQKTIPIMVLGT